MISAIQLIKNRQDSVLNYFATRATNAAAESLNAKMKWFRAELRGVADNLRLSKEYGEIVQLFKINWYFCTSNYAEKNT